MPCVVASADAPADRLLPALPPLPLGAASATAALPPGLVIDADACLLALATLHLAGRTPCDPLTALVDLLARHPIRTHLATRAGARFCPSPLWPTSPVRGHGGHKGILDRLRKLHTLGLVVLVKDWLSGITFNYTSDITSAGMDRAVAVAAHTGCQLKDIT